MIPDLFSYAHFDGTAYEPQHDKARLTGQILRVYDLMSDGKWRTLREIASLTGDPEASVSAQLRNLRKKRFGSHTINRRRRGDPGDGVHEYKIECFHKCEAGD